MLQWAVELSEFDLKYEARTTIKPQYLTNFVVEYTKSPGDPTTWSLYVDGSSNKAGSGAGVILESNQGVRIVLSLRFDFPASNNQAEYEALLTGLKLEKEVGAEKLAMSINSQVITSQINETYQAKDPTMKKYLEVTREQLAHFIKSDIRHITRKFNARADALSKLASTKPGVNNSCLIQETLQTPSISKEEDNLKPEALTISN
ncbi:uncharacterized protein [Arachis hypogaea]|uniref:uncharacterized protein n=1 Tax=Arachis hypogaea TaxID=3818 RepID=UPI003B218B36